MRIHRWTAPILFVVALGTNLATAPPAAAATITVNSLIPYPDAPACGLGDAIFAANQDIPVSGCPSGSPGDDTIVIDVVGTINLGPFQTQNLLSNIVINGPGASSLTIRRDGTAPAMRIFSVGAGKTATIEGVTISHGLMDSVGSAGAAVYNFGTLTLDGVVVRNNHLTVTSDSINPAPGGGAIYNAGIMTIKKSTVTENSVTTTQTATSGMRSASAYGGGIDNQGTLTIDQSTISNNSVGATVASPDASGSDSGGGGVSSNTSGSLTITRSTISGNSATATAPSGSFSVSRAGGIANRAGSAEISSSTVAFNTAGVGANLWGQGAEVVTSSIISDPQGGSNCSDPSSDGGHNIIFPNTCQDLATNGGDPLLLPLGSYGGPTQTHQIPVASPALDMGYPDPTPDAKDQRGEARPVDFLDVGYESSEGPGYGADVGAFEQSDMAPPVDPSVVSPSHSLSVASGDRTVQIAWSGASDDASGVDGFSYAWTTGSTDVPDSTKDAEQTATGVVSPSLPTGSHWFHLRTTDHAGHWTSTVHLGPFVIDATVPSTTITSARIRRATRKATFRFSASEPGSVFFCNRDGKAFKRCSSPKTYRNLRTGRHKFRVFAVDAVGNKGPTLVRRFRI